MSLESRAEGVLEPFVGIKGQGTKGQAGELALLPLWHILLTPSRASGGTAGGWEKQDSRKKEDSSLQGGAELLES